MGDTTENSSSHFVLSPLKVIFQFSGLETMPVVAGEQTGGMLGQNDCSFQPKSQRKALGKGSE